MRSMEKRTLCPSMLAGYLTLVAFQMNLVKTDYDGGALVRYRLAFSDFSIQHFFMFAGLVFLFYFLFTEIRLQTGRRNRDYICAGVCGAFFALCMILGMVMDADETLRVLYEGKLQICKTVTVFLGYATAFSSIILYLFYKAAGVNVTTAPVRTANDKRGILQRFLDCFEKHPFQTSFVFICVCFLPYIVLSYPAILQGDASPMIAQGFNLPNIQAQRLVLLDEQVFLNGHHPLAYTLLIHGCLVAGKTLFDSYSVGVFLVSLIQFLFAAAVISYLMQTLVCCKVNRNLCIAVLAFYCFSPRTVSYMFVLTKDVIYAYSVLLLIILISKVTLLERKEDPSESHKKTGKAGMTWLAVVLLGCVSVFFRNEGKYIISLWFLFLIIKFKKNRRMFAGALVIVLLLLGFVNRVVMPYYKITPGSIREMLSVPFQQTARYVATYPDEVTAYERETIDKILIYDTLAERYDQNRSDEVKNRYNKYATREDLKEYVYVWFQMFKKHPSVYVEATLHNYYRYVYPGKKMADNYSYEWSATCMVETNRQCEEVGMDISYPQQLEKFRTHYETLREKLFVLPVLNALKNTAVYVWAMLLLGAYLLWKREYGALLVLVIPMLESLGVAFLGPCNGDYYRYAFPFTVILPAAIVIGLYTTRRSSSPKD